MPTRTYRSSRVVKVLATAALMSVLLAACAPAPEPSGSAAASADDAAIRQFLTHVEEVFDASDLDAAVAVFTDDAMILAQGAPDAVGAAAIRGVYESALAQSRLGVRFHTEEIETFGDFAYERGTYTLTVADKVSGQTLATLTNRHIHILKRQPNGGWKTWRMLTNSAEPVPVPGQ